MILIVTLTVRSEMLDEFRRYEQVAATIMAKYGGAIEAVYVLDEPLREVHVVRFPDEGAFVAYRADADLVALRPTRDACIVATTIERALEGPRY